MKLGSLKAPKHIAEDTRRLAKGAALVLSEAAESSDILRSLLAGDITGVLQSTAISAAEAAGLTSGTPRSFPHHPQPSERYYDETPSAPALPTPNPQQPTTTTRPPAPAIAPGFAAAAALTPTQEPPKTGTITARDSPPINTTVPTLKEASNTSSVPSISPSGPQSSHGDASIVPSEEGEEGSGSPSGSDLRGAGSAELAVPSAQLASDPASSAGGPGAKSKRRRQPRERTVPAGPISRVMGFAGLGASLAVGTLQEVGRRVMFGRGSDAPGAPYSAFLTEANAERLAAQLCRMRGAALKLGQMLSIQDEGLLPPQISAALESVRQGADIMPRRQLERVLRAELGDDWRSRVRDFDFAPIASASIGQVHRAVLHDGREVAMKVQYPGVAESIDSDIDNLRRLLDYTNLVPKGLYLSHAIKVAKEELAMECDYTREAESQKRFQALIAGLPGFSVPTVIDNLCSKRVLTSELVPGIPIDRVASMDQATRNRVASRILVLTLKELFEFRFMQTDPNWGNFLYDAPSDTLMLIDFGAARDFPKPFVDEYLRMVRACADRDRAEVLRASRALGFLTGNESQTMLDAHTEAAFVVGLPFSSAGGFDFRVTDLTKRVSALGAVMLRERLTPPPDEAYSLHRKLSGAFLASIKLGAVVPCRDYLLETYEAYNFGPEIPRDTTT